MMRRRFYSAVTRRRGPLHRLATGEITGPVAKEVSGGGIRAPRNASCGPTGPSVLRTVRA